MSVTSHIRGWPIIFKDGKWVYADIGEDVFIVRPCKRCGQWPTKEGYDACLGHIPGAKSACCGHGVTKPFIMMSAKKMIAK